MDKALVDTDTLSEIVKGKDARIAETARSYLATHGRLTISVITVMEVVQGFRRVQREPQLERFLSRLRDFEILSVDTRAAILAGQIYGDLKRIGQPIGRADPMIAATAIAAGLPVVTGNVAHYERIAAVGFPLVIQNWRVSEVVRP